MKQFAMLLLIVVVQFAVGPLPSPVAAQSQVRVVTTPPKPLRSLAEAGPLKPPPGPPRPMPPRSLPGGRARRPSVPTPAPGDGGGTDIGWATGGASALAYYAAHEVHSTLELPPVAPGGAELRLYAPTGLNADNCLEAATSYLRGPGSPSTTREFFIFSHCNPVYGVVVWTEINAAFIQDYVASFRGRNVYFVQVQQSRKPDGVSTVGYQAFIWNWPMQRWDWIYDLQTAALPQTLGGWAAHESFFRNSGFCPSLPPIVADEIQVRLPTGPDTFDWFYVTPSYGAQMRLGYCYADPATYTLTFINLLWTWQVTTP